MTTTDYTQDVRCKLSVDKYREVYLQGRTCHQEGLALVDNPYPHKSGTKKGQQKRIAWFVGFLDSWREKREKFYEECRSNPSNSK